MLHAQSWLWVALDPCTKLIPALALGPRTQLTAHTLVHSLRAMLAPASIPVITTDGLRPYFYALTAHFGRWIAAGRRALRLSMRALGWSGKLQAASVERANLTVRQSIAALTRRAGHGSDRRRPPAAARLVARLLPFLAAAPQFAAGWA